MSRQEPPGELHEPDVRRWRRAWRLIFLLLSGAAAWVLVVVVVGFVWRWLGR